MTMQADIKKSGTEEDLKALPMAELLTKLGASPDGLNQDEVKQRLAAQRRRPNKRIGNFLSMF